MKRAKLLIVDDDDLFLKSISKELGRMGFPVRTAANAAQALDELRSFPPDVMLLDIRLPDRNGADLLKTVKQRDPSIEVVMLTAYGTVDSAVGCLQAGAYHYLVKPAKLSEIEALVQKAYERKTLRLENQRLKDQLNQTRDDVIVGSSAPVQELLSLVERVAPGTQTVLILGESGTGKELVARRIHRLSPRRDRPLVLLDCASLSKNLLETELFGHEKGAFTGADAVKRGLLETADTGTLFVDEVGALATEMQSDFLRMLETQEYRRVGGTAVRKSDVRILAATNENLQEAVRQGRFREDLFFRLSVIVLEVPPLRQRKEDIPALAEHLLRQAGYRRAQKRISPEALLRLQEHDWPGNVRELRNVIERAALLSQEELIRESDLRMISLPGRAAPVGRPEEEELVSLRELQTRYIRRVLAKVKGNRQKAAKILGVDPKTIYRRLKGE